MNPQRKPATQSRPMGRVAAGGMDARQVGSPTGGRRTAAIPGRRFNSNVSRPALARRTGPVVQRKGNDAPDRLRNPGAFRGERNGEKNDAILASDRTTSSLRRRDVAHPRFEPGGGDPLADEPSRNDEAWLPMFLGGAARLNRSAFRFPLRRGERAAWMDTRGPCSLLSLNPIAVCKASRATPVNCGRVPQCVCASTAGGTIAGEPGRARNSFSLDIAERTRPQKLAAMMRGTLPDGSRAPVTRAPGQWGHLESGAGGVRLGRVTEPNNRSGCAFRALTNSRLSMRGARAGHTPMRAGRGDNAPLMEGRNRAGRRTHDMYHQPALPLASDW